MFGTINNSILLSLQTKFFQFYRKSLFLHPLVLSFSRISKLHLLRFVWARKNELYSSFSISFFGWERDINAHSFLLLAFPFYSFGLSAFSFSAFTISFQSFGISTLILLNFAFLYSPSKTISCCFGRADHSWQYAYKLGWSVGLVWVFPYVVGLHIAISRIYV